MTPKMLLRHPLARSPVEDFLTGQSFQRVISDNGKVIENPSGVKRIVLCTGKHLYRILLIACVSRQSVRRYFQCTGSTETRKRYCTGSCWASLSVPIRPNQGGVRTIWKCRDYLGTRRTKEHGSLDICTTPFELTFDQVIFGDLICYLLYFLASVATLVLSTRDVR